MQSKKNKIFYILFLIIIFLYAYVGFCSPGFEDDFFNIYLIEDLGFKVLSYIQTKDVHPPGSYFLNWFFYSLTNSWSIVRLISGFLTALSIIYAGISIRKAYGDLRGFLFLIFLAFNPGVLMWGTSLRWYSYFLPLLIYLSITPNPSNKFYWAKVFIGLLLLGYIGYAAFIVAPSLVFLYWRQSDQSIKEKLKKVFLWGALSLLFYIPQLNIFLTVHINESGSQRFSLLNGFAGFVMSHLSNHGVFPISLAGFLGCLGASGVIFLSLKKDFKKILLSNYGFSYIMGIFFLIISGLGGKYRNFVIFSPLQSFSLSIFIPDLRQNNWVKAFLFCFLFGNVIGIYNVIFHKNTIKNSWNFPLKKVMNQLEIIKSSCGHETLLFVHDPVLTYALEKKNYFVVSPFGKEKSKVYKFKLNYKCIVIAKTFVGALKNSKIKKMYTAVEGVAHKIEEKIYIGFDPYYSFKKKLDSRYPKYQVELFVLRSANFDDLMNGWQSLDRDRALGL